MTDGGKGSKRRTENTAAVEANWPTNWNAREVEDGLSGLHGDAVQDGEAHGAGAVQETDPPTPGS